MGLADYAAGAGPAGFDPVVAPSQPRDARAPVALRLDGQTRDYLLDANGRYIESHPVDQKVALALTVTFGSIASAPTTGNKLRRISRVSAGVAQTLAEDYVRTALAELTAARDVALDLVEVDTSQRGALLVAVTYRNLRLAGTAPRTVTFGAA